MILEQFHSHVLNENNSIDYLVLEFFIPDASILHYRIKISMPFKQDCELKFEIISYLDTYLSFKKSLNRIRWYPYDSHFCVRTSIR